MKVYYSLSDRIAGGKYLMVQRLLDNNSDLDLMYDNGTFFNMAIENNNYDIVKTLLDYFTKNQLSDYEESTYEYSNLKSKMRNVLETAIEDVPLSEEMKQVLSSYISFDDDCNIWHDSSLDMYDPFNMDWLSSPKK